MRTARIDDVARLAGVSIKTVSRVVNHEPNVRESTRSRVQRAIDELNYRPNRAARDLASHHSHLICLIYDDPSAYEIPSAGYIIRMQEGALRACKKADYELLIHPCRYRDSDVGDELRALIEQVRPDGIVLAAPLSNMSEIRAAIEATGTPLVSLSPGQGNGEHLSVTTNDQEISAEMTHYLASLGHERIAFIKGNRTHQAVGLRFLGYRDGLRQNGLRFSERLVAEGDNSVRSGEACALELLQQEQPPTAIFAANDDMAAGVIRTATRLGISVPGQLSVAGCDDIPLAQQIYPSLTTINQPLSTMTERAADALIEHTSEKRVAEGTLTVPAELRIRDSTGPAPRG